MVKERERPDGSTYLSGRDVEREQDRLRRAHEKNTALLDTARKSGSFQTAGVDLLIWLGKDIPVHPDTSYGFYVDTDELRDRMGPWSGGERRVASVALSLLDAGTVDLRDVIGGTGGEHRRRIIAAIAAAADLPLIPAGGVVPRVDSVPQGDIPSAGPLTLAPDQIV